MNMNIVDIVLLALVLLIILQSYFKGFLISVVSLVRFLVGIPLCYAGAKNFAEPVYNAVAKNAIASSVSESVQNSGLDSVIKTVKEGVAALPESLRGIVDTSFLNSAGSETAANQIMENIVDPIALVVCKIILFVLFIIVFFILTGIIISIIKSADKKIEPLKKADRSLGAVLGALKAIVILFAVSAAAGFITKNFAGSGGFVNELSSSIVIGFLNKFNPLFLI